MERKLYEQLLDWKNSAKRKPLLLQGARQVGKTYLVRQFGQKEYANFIELNFEKNAELVTLFEGSLDPHVILENIGLYIGKSVDYTNTLLFFDEIQTSPKVLTSLKYFQELAPEYHIVAAGSLLGVSVGKQTSFPVGKVNFLNMHPMTFLEYLTAFDEQLLVKKLLSESSIVKLPDIVHEKLIKYYKLYLYIGGMPEVVDDYIKNRDIESVRTIQNDILNAYQKDFSKYTEKNQAIRTAELWRSIPFQLAKENKKFRYGDVRKKARAITFEQTIEWLRKAGLINIAYNISTPKLPLSGYTDYSKFKVYLLDTGLLGAMLKLPSSTVIQPEKLFKEYNGAFVENYVAQELTAQNVQPLFYWTSRSDAEVDFILQKESEILPLEVKSGSSIKAKSLKSYNEKYKPKLLIRTSPKNFVKSDNFINLPLYSISRWIALL